VTPERVAEITNNPESIPTLPEMMESPYDYRLELADLEDDSIRAIFVLTPRSANVNRLMREKGVPVLAVKEFALYMKVSGEAKRDGQPGMDIAGLKRVLAFRYAGRELDLMPQSITYERPEPPPPEEEPCSSSSTSSDDARPADKAASTSTKTSPSPPAEPASETPD